MKIKLLLVLLCLGQFVISQTKNEKEERIKPSNFPLAAQQVVTSLPSDCKRLKFYKETDGQKESFEAKFKYKGKRYSLEFSKEGNIEDLEVLTKIKSIEATISSKIIEHFESTYTKHKLIKIQEQYVYNTATDPIQFVNRVLNEKSDIAPNFEIIAEVKLNKQRELRELTFNGTGQFLNFRTVNPSSYEHVLY